MAILNEVKEFFADFPKPGSLAYKFAMWQFDRKQGKGYVSDPAVNEILFKFSHDNTAGSSGTNDEPLRPEDIGWDPRIDN